MCFSSFKSKFTSQQTHISHENTNLNIHKVINIYSRSYTTVNISMHRKTWISTHISNNIYRVERFKFIMSLVWHIYTHVHPTWPTCTWCIYQCNLGLLVYKAWWSYSIHSPKSIHVLVLLYTLYMFHKMLLPVHCFLLSKIFFTL